LAGGHDMRNTKVGFDRLVTQQPTSFLHMQCLPKLFLYLFFSVFYCRVEYVSMENVTLRKKLDALELNNR